MTCGGGEDSNANMIRLVGGIFFFFESWWVEIKIELLQANKYTKPIDLFRSKMEIHLTLKTHTIYIKEGIKLMSTIKNVEYIIGPNA